MLLQFGRRKSWLIPTQLMIAAILLGSAAYVDGLLNRAEPDVLALTVLFILLYTLCATQDIAVDGYATPVVNKENSGDNRCC
jgi:PAT family acetyl-CoA transporter-like MFS transporter 1